MDNTPAPTQDTNIPDSDFSSSAPLGTTPSTDLETSSPSNPPPPFEDTSYDVPPPKKSKKSFAALLVVLFLVLALPVAIYVAQHRQEYRQRAAYCLADGNSCGGSSLDCCSFCNANTGRCGGDTSQCVAAGGTCGSGQTCCAGTNCNTSLGVCVTTGAGEPCLPGFSCNIGQSLCGAGEFQQGFCRDSIGNSGACCRGNTCVPDYCIAPYGGSSCTAPMFTVRDTNCSSTNTRCTCTGGGTQPTPSPLPNPSPLNTCFRCSATNNFCESYLQSATCSTDCSACTPGGGVPTPSPATSGFAIPTPTPATQAVIGDFVWNDTNQNGLQDLGETGIPGVVVTLYDSSGNVVATTTTNSSGFYSFTVQPGSYTIGITPPSGFTYSPANQGSNDSVDSDVLATTSKTDVFTVTAGQTDLTHDVGLFNAPSPTPTPAPVAQCLNIKAYSVGVVSDPSSWVLLTTTQLQNLQPGQTIYITVLGSVQNGAAIDKARIRVNSTSWTTANETTSLKPSSQEYYISYTIPTGVNSFVFDAEVHDQATNLWY